MPLDSWRDTKETLHRFCQVVGRSAWPQASGATIGGTCHSTSPAAVLPPDPWDRPTATRSSPSTSTSSTTSCASTPWPAKRSRSRCKASRWPRSTTTSWRRWTGSGSKRPSAIPRPFDLPDADRRFADDTEHAGYDPAWASRYWQVLSHVDLLLEEFAVRFSGKVSPVHHFWHTFDIAHTRFADRHVDQPSTADSVTREAYSREVISFGFWVGDDRIGEPAFYAYTAPEPDGLASEPLQPGIAWWDPRDGSHLAVLRYDDARASDDPRATVLDFYESAYQAGARLGY